jgi:hypothetical protein
MHKALAYEVLCRELQGWSSMPTAELVARIGEQTSNSQVAGTEEIQVEVVASWADAEREFILITARAFGPSHWQLEQLEESVKVRAVRHMPNKTMEPTR